jgi:hypothetical protein
VRTRPLGDQPVHLDAVPPDHPGALLARWLHESDWLARAAQRLYDEMAHAYHEQAELDLEITRVFLPTALKSLRHEED